MFNNFSFLCCLIYIIKEKICLEESKYHIKGGSGLNNHFHIFTILLIFNHRIILLLKA